MNKFLITGVKSGLGRFLHEKFGGVGLTRDNWSDVSKESYEVIIHCAFNSALAYRMKNFEDLILEDMILTRNLTKLPHELFIFISSVDVYTCQSTYAISKKVNEKLVEKYAKSYLILRPSVLLGKHSRPNSLIRLITENPVVLTVSPSSTFNYILHEDVGNFIQYAVSKKLTGNYNLASSENITFAEVEELIFNQVGDKNVVYGKYVYRTNKIDISKLIQVGGFPIESSKQVIKEFIKSL